MRVGMDMGVGRVLGVARWNVCLLMVQRAQKSQGPILLETDYDFKYQTMLASSITLILTIGQTPSRKLRSSLLAQVGHWRLMDVGISDSLGSS